jgi:hypothetical protein
MPLILCPFEHCKKAKQANTGKHKLLSHCSNPEINAPGIYPRQHYRAIRCSADWFHSPGSIPDNETSDNQHFYPTDKYLPAFGHFYLPFVLSGFYPIKKRCMFKPSFTVKGSTYRVRL